MADNPQQPSDLTPAVGGADSAASAQVEAQIPPPTPTGVETDFLRQEDLDALFQAAGAVPSDGAGESPNVADVESSFGVAATAVADAVDTIEATTTPKAVAASAPSVQQFQYPDFGVSGVAGVDAKCVTMLSDVNLRVKIELGRTRMLVENVLKLGEGSVVELDKLAGDPVDVYANDRLVARGEVLVLDDSFCVRINEVLSRDPHRITR